MKLREIELENFRVFKEPTAFEFKPITIITGPNSSGKSSLFKALLLLKDSIDRDKGRTLNFHGDMHHLGEFEKAISKQADGKDAINFSLKFDLDKKYLPELFERNIYVNYSFGKELNITKISCKRGDVELFVFRLYVFDNGNSFIEINQELLIEHYLKEENYSTPPFEKGEVISKDKLREELASFDKENVERFIEILNQNYKSNLRYYYSKDEGFTLEKANRSFDRQYKSHYLIMSSFWETDIVEGAIGEHESYNGTPYQYDFRLKNAEALLKGTDEFQDYYNYLEDTAINYIHSGYLSFIASEIPKIITPFLEELSNNLTVDIDYLEAVRANTRRIYTLRSEGTGFNKLLLDFDNLFKSIKPNQVDFINRWLKEFDIADRMRIDSVEGVANKIVLEKDGKDTILADLGYGFTQFISILFKILLVAPPSFFSRKMAFEVVKNDLKLAGKSEGISKEKKRAQYQPSFTGDFLMLEEPETNLHPKLQSKIADMLSDASSELGVNFLVETHSEYLIRKFQYMVATKKIDPEHIVIYYIYPPNQIPEGRKQVEKIRIKPDGLLDNQFGAGFFDEATKLMVSAFTGESLN